MRYKSLNQKSDKVSFQDAVTLGLAPDKGLYFPEEINPLDENFLANIENLTDVEIALEVLKPFICPDIPENKLKEILSETLNFEFPIVHLSDNCATQELFHGPTLAFKDVGARFMARCIAYFNVGYNSKKNLVLVATSGDTGGAVANGFYKVPNVKVVILYPKGKVSEIQKKQLTTLKNNITALEVDGVFDDCQDLVKTAFLDSDLKNLNLTSANSINIARWLPQMIYYFLAFKQLKHLNKPLFISVPSGNFGNICAGIVAQKMGLPIQKFIAATNENDTVLQFLKSGEYIPKTSVATLSNAMDVGNPSNFIRVQELFEYDINKMKEKFSSYSYSDNETIHALKEIYEKYNYIADPHGAVGYLGLQEELKKHPEAFGLFMETAHPVKFLETVENHLNISIPLPENIRQLQEMESYFFPVKTYSEVKKFLINLE
ncbi:threonine synthase [Flavobacterium sp.]|uniref:threonine synthase n=1 Tax=Flavobacterium sp. TaxID=239 RepID=UPI002FD8A9D0